jgi:NAD-dependent deacetylase
MHKPVVAIFSGAGLSAESGIPTFRDANGLWESHKIEDVASPAGWRLDKSLVIEFYKQRFYNIQKCQPSDAHRAFAKLETKYSVKHFTQNIDDLLERAGCTAVSHIHGSITQRKCEEHTSLAFAGAEASHRCNYLETHSKPVELGDACPECGCSARPNVVWFGEPVDLSLEHHATVVEAINQTKGFAVVVGTSATVQPAASLIDVYRYCHNAYFVDLNTTSVPGYSMLPGKASEMIPMLVERMLQ